MLGVLFKPRSVLISTSVATDLVLGRLESQATVNGNSFRINSRAFDLFYRGCYVVGKVEKSDFGNSINAEIRPTSHVKAGTFLLLLCISLGLIPLTLQLVNNGMSLIAFFAGVFGLVVLAALVCLIARGMFLLSASIKEKTIRQLIKG